MVYQAIRNKNYANIIVIGAAYIATALICILLYSTRLYTNRSVLANIPKFYIPVEKGEVGSKVRRMIEKGLERSAIVAWDSRPRDLRGDIDALARADAGLEGHGRDEIRPKRKSHLDHATVIPVNPVRPPWGEIAHPGWSSPGSEDLPNLHFHNVVMELPNLIEAKAVSLAPPDPAFADGMGSGMGEKKDVLAAVPDARIVAALQRPETMNVRDYVAQLSSFGLIEPLELESAFVTQYENARFSTSDLTEVQFRELMSTFGQILSGMHELNALVIENIIAAMEPDLDEEDIDDGSLLADGFGPNAEEASISDAGSAIHYKTPRMQSLAFAPESDDASSNEGTVRTAPSRRTASAAQPQRTVSATSGGSVIRTTVPQSSSPLSSSSSSLRSAQSVIRVTPSPRDGEMPYQWTFPMD